MYEFTVWSDAEEGVAPIPSDFLLTFWTPVLGPSSVLLLRTLGLVLTHATELRIEGADLGAMLGLRGDGRHSPVVRTLRRLEQFGFLRSVGEDAYEVRLTAPELSTRQFDTLPSPLKTAYGMRRARQEARA